MAHEGLDRGKNAISSLGVRLNRALFGGSSKWLVACQIYFGTQLACAYLLQQYPVGRYQISKDASGIHDNCGD